MNELNIKNYDSKLAIMVGSIISFFDKNPKHAALILKHLFDEKAFKIYYKEAIRMQKARQAELSEYDKKTINIINNNLKTLFFIMHGRIKTIESLVGIDQLPLDQASLVSKHTSVIVASLIKRLETLEYSYI